MPSRSALSRPQRRNADDVAVRVETPSGNIADLLENLRNAVHEVLQRHGVSLHDSQQLVYQPVLPESNAEGPICLTVHLKQPLTGEILAMWEDESRRAVLLYAVSFHFSMTAQQPSLPFSVGQPVPPLEQPEEPLQRVNESRSRGSFPMGPRRDGFTIGVDPAVPEGEIVIARHSNRIGQRSDLTSTPSSETSNEDTNDSEIRSETPSASQPTYFKETRQIDL